MQSLNQAPFPALEWAEFRWEGFIAAPAWAEFRLSEGDDEQTDGDLQLGVHTADDEPAAATFEQAAAFEFYVANEARVRDAILAELLARYPQWQQNYGYNVEEKEQFMPDVANSDGFKPLLELSGIDIFVTSKDNCAYIGVSCNCEWDPEHAFGAMMHRDRVVEIGGADVAILEWIAEKDADPK